jgi:hypothetical protein
MIFNLNSLVLSIFILLLGATNNLHVVHSASQLRGRTDSNSNNQDRMMIMDRSQLQTQILTDLRKMQQQQQQTEGPSDSPINSEISDEDNNIGRWPNLVDLTGDQAKLKLEEDYGADTYNIIVLRYDSPVTRDISHNRIRIYVDESNIVVKVPVIG